MLKFLQFKKKPPTNHQKPKHKQSVSRSSEVVLNSVCTLCHENNVSKQKGEGEYLSTVEFCCL